MLRLKINCILIIVSLIITGCIYAVGLDGDYLFDDFGNILNNTNIQIYSLSYQELKRAYYSGDAGPLGRPISMLSFALNYYFTGFDTFYFKLTNLCIHVLNGLLLYIFSLKILNYLSKSHFGIRHKTEYMALVIALIWLVHPINLTSILYVVQRMTSLSTMFGFIAVTLYCCWRSRNNSILSTSLYWMVTILCLLAAALSKESGLLFIGLIYWIELLIFRGRDLHLNDIKLVKLKLINLLWLGVIAGGVGLIYLAIPYISMHTAANRDFSNVERLLTQSRVIFYYLKLIFYPLLSDLSLYHDDFLISKSITNPQTTLWSVIAFFCISLTSIFLVKKYPLILFAWGWFVISQLMESTFISLELVHEHRNYFSTIGFIFAIIFYASQITAIKIKYTVYLFGLFYTLNLAVITWQRAGLWSNLVDHALYEAHMHPFSDRANYQLARIFIKLMQNDESKKKYYAEKSNEYIEKAKKSYNPANGAWFLELHLASYLNEDIKNKTIDELIWNLKNKPFYNSNIGFLSNFSTCQINGFCNIEHNQAIKIISAGLKNPVASNEIKAEIYKLLANYFVSVAGDFIKAEEFINHAISLTNDINGHMLASQIYILDGKFDIAKSHLNLASQLDENEIWHHLIEKEHRKIENGLKSKDNNEN